MGLFNVLNLEESRYTCGKQVPSHYPFFNKAIIVSRRGVMCMHNALYYALYALGSPFILICMTAQFIVWGNYSDKRQVIEQRRSNPASYWVGRATEAESRFRELDYKSRRKIEELENKLLEERNKKR